MNYTLSTSDLGGNPSLLSTNGTGNIITFLALALAAAFGIGEEPTMALIAAVGPFVMFIREIIKGTRKIRWAGNIITYLAGAITLAAPQLTDLIAALQPLAEAVASGNFTIALLIPLMLPVLNEIIVLFQRSPKQPVPA